MTFVPKEMFLTKGVGRHKDKLTSFEEALRVAQIAQFNLVHVSSILPPGCKIIPCTKGVKKLHAGQIVYCVMSRNEVREKNRLMSAAVGVAIPKDSNQYGYLSEYHSFGEKEKEAGDYTEDIAAMMLATTLGVDFDPNESWDRKKETWKIDGRIYRTTDITQTAIGHSNSEWTTVLAAAVFIG